MVSKYIIALFFVGVLHYPISAPGQEAPERAKKTGWECYSEHFVSEEGEAVFTRITLEPSFKGGPGPFLKFLMKSIDFGHIEEALPKHTTSYADTAFVKFIISKFGHLSDLTVSGTMNEAYKQEVLKAFITSSCFWEPGDNSGRKVNGWMHIKVYYSYERRAKNIAVHISFDILDP